VKFIITLCIVALTSISQQGYLLAQSPSSTIISTNLDILVEQAVKKYSRKDFTGAIGDLNQAIKANSKYAKAYNARGIVKFAIKDWEGSIKDYNIAIDLDPKYARAYSNRGLLKLGQGDFDNASSDFNLAINLDPSLANAYNNRGLLLIKLGKREAAIKDFQKCAQLYEAQGDKESARQSLETIKKLNTVKV
jgi:tetratricopeptide (TPR) repeat protein